MSTIVGHTLAASVVSAALVRRRPVQRRRWLFVLAIAVALIPDLDIFIYLAFRPLGMVPHRGFSHSLLFGVLSSGLMVLIFGRFFGLSRTKLFGVLLGAAVTHPFLDFLMGCGPEVPFFAPFIDKGFLSPVQLVPTAFYGKTMQAFVAVTFSAASLLAVALEMVIFVPLLMIFTKERSAPRCVSDSVVVAVELLISAAGLLITVCIYN
jgi:membrane-bound metal-dependent hydrolase YbcI (DUF457 family)